MTPFLQLRLWLRRGPRSEKVLSGTVALIVLALLGWALVPGTGGTTGAGTAAAGSASSEAGGSASSGPVSRPPAAPGEQPGATVTGPAGGGGSRTGGGDAATVGPGAVGADTVGSATGPASGHSQACASVPNGAGVTATTVHLGVVLLSLAGPVGNQAVGVASPQSQQDMAQALIDDINKAGGVQCRRLVPTYYQVNPVDSVNQHSECLQIVQDDVFAVIDGGGFSYPIASRDCVVQNKIPLYSQVGIVPSEGNQQFYPYLFSPAAVYDMDMRDVVLGAKARGYFSSGSGFRLLGLLEDDCTPEVNGDLAAALSQAGIGAAKINKFVFACPSTGFAPPSAMAQAVEQFKLAGVSNLIPITGGGSFDTFTRIAQQQDFRPHYAVSDYDGLSSTVESSQGPDPQNFDGAIATVPWRTGQLASNLPPDPATQRCNHEMTAHGLPTMAESSAIQGVYCALFSMFITSAQRAPGLARTSLVDGLDTAGTIGFSFPFADGTFNRPHKIAGGDFWRPIQWHASCTCWRVLDPAYQPSFG